MAISRMGAIVAAFAVFVVLAAGASARSLQGVSSPPPPPSAAGVLYVKIQATEMNTQVGQQPKLVAQFGNTGNAEIKNVGGTCYDDYKVLRYDSQIYTAQKLIPGQNQNFEFTFTAVGAGTTTLYCQLYGTTGADGHTVYANSNTVTVKVTPQQG